MGEPLIQNSFVSGELSPSLWGRTDLDKYHSAAAVMRNMFVDYRSGATSRAGTAFVGFAGGQGGGLSTPARLIPFQYSATETYVIEMGAGYFRFIFQGGYVTETSQAITGITNANPAVFSVGTSIPNGSLVFITAGIGLNYAGTSNCAVNNRYFFVSGSNLIDPVTNQALNAADLSAFSSAQIAIVYSVSNPYNATDLRVIKFTQSGDTMTLTHVNYPAANLTRTTPSTWTYSVITFGSSLAVPVITSTTAFDNGTGNGYDYGYVVTAFDDITHEESNASAPVSMENLALGTPGGAGLPMNILTWDAIPNGTRYNIYKQPPFTAGATSTSDFQIFGYAGQTQTTQWTDANFAPDYSQAPPIHYDPFGASGNPGVCCYFQERAVFAGTSSEPQAVFMSRPGLFQNMDYSIPSQPADAINISINAQDLSIIQSATAMPSGLILLTGEGAWQITGGGLFQPVTPSTINAQPQAFSGASYLQPLRINYDLLYVQARGYAVRRLQYNFYFNVYAGTDISVLSAHLFEGRQIVEWCYAEQPFYLAWCLREDGILLTLTYLAEQAVEGWARHDTQGYFQSIASVPEGPEDAVYVIVRRCAVIGGVPNYYQTTERFASRLLGNNLAQATPGKIENAWCVDVGVQIAPGPVSANLFITLTGAGALGDVAVLAGGSGYPAVLGATVVDQFGTGATVEVVVVDGVITGINVLTTGSGYISPVIVLEQTSGRGAVFQAYGITTCLLTSDQPVFQMSEVIRASGGRAIITTLNSASSAIATILEPFTQFIPSTAQVAPPLSGTWTMGGNYTQVIGLDHLEGQMVTGLADGDPIPPTVVVNGAITLAVAASLITVGLPFTCQLQTLPIDAPGQGTIQGKRKFISAATLRVTETEGLTVGPSWGRMTPIKNVGFNGGSQFANGGGVQSIGYDGVYGQQPVVYADQRILMGPNWGPNGQICIQQSNPLPASVVAIMPEITIGDMPA